MEEIISIKWWKTYSNKKCFVQLVNLFHFPFCHPKEGSCLFGKASKRFSLGKEALEHKLQLMNQSIKQKGGLSVRNLSIFNETFLGKQCWKFVSERNPLWKQVIVSKYKQEERGWCTKEAREGCGVGVWKAIRGGWEAFKDRTVFKVGFKNWVKFWKNQWYGDMPLRGSFLEFYSIVFSKIDQVVDVWDESTWSPRL